jgi:hypothetical protein
MASRLPQPSKSPPSKMELLRNLALIYAWTGEKQLALDQIAAALQGRVT